MNAILRTALALAVMIGSVTAEAQGVLTPTGGTLVGVSPTTVNAAYGPFSASSTFLNQTLSSVSGSYSQTAFAVGSAANTIYSAPLSPTVGSNSGTLGFTLSAATDYQFVWSSSPVQPGTTAFASVTVTGSAGNVVISCAEAQYPSPGGCAAGPGAGTGSVALSPTLLATLPADTYSVAFSNSGGYLDGTPIDSDFSFSFGPPPPPVPPTVSPAVQGTLGANGWYVSAAQISWDVGGTPTPVTSGCGTVVATDTSGTTYTCTATNSAGTASGSVTIKQDTVPPTIIINAPAGQGTYRRKRRLLASYSCADATSGVATCVGTVANGTPVDTSTAGIKRFTVTATDNAGNQSAQTAIYTVR